MKRNIVSLILTPVMILFFLLVVASQSLAYTVTTQGLNGAALIAAGASASHTLALKNDGTVIAWGDNYYGQTTVPAGLTGVKALAAGSAYTAALKNDGTVVAWGYNDHGETIVPPGLSGVAAIAAGVYHTVALKEDHTVVAWGIASGDGYFGQTAVPAGLSGVTAIAAGGYHTAALKEDHTVVAWGVDSGYFYYGQTAVPAGLTGVTAIAAGGYHTVALKDDGTVVAWGNNTYGQTAVPAGLSGVTAIAAGSYHTVALKDDGTVVAWGVASGASYLGQTAVPAGLSGVTAIAAGSDHTAVLKNDGTVVAWGDNWYGQAQVPADLSAAILNGDITCESPVNDDANSVCAIAPNTGYHLSAFRVNGADQLANVSGNSYAIEHIHSNQTIVAAFSTNTYTISSTADVNGTITPTATINHGSNAIFAITPGANYHVADVLVDGVSVGAVASYTFANVTAAHSIAAAFAINAYAITAGAGAHGSIAPSGTVDVNQGAGQGFAITPDQGYRVADVLVDGVSVGAVTSYNFDSVTMPHTIVASFVPKTHLLSVAKTGTGAGKVTAAGIDCGVDCSETYDWGTSVQLTAAADSGSSFSGWSGACSGTTNPCTITIDMAKTLTAIFADVKPPSGTVTINGNEANALIQFVILGLSTDSAGVSLMRVSNDNATWSEYPYATSQAWTLSGGDGTKTVYAKFWDGVWSDPVFDTIILDTTAPTTTANPRGGTYDGNRTVLLAADEQATIHYTTDGSPPTISSTSYSSGIPVSANTILKFFAVDAAGNAETVQTESYTLTRNLTVRMSGTGNGSVSGPAGLGWSGAMAAGSYTHGVQVSLTANPGTDSIFTGWTGDCAGTARECTVTMNQARDATATFTLDTTAPLPPANIRASVPAKTWTKTRRITANWDAGSDANGTGVKGYGYVWDTYLDTVPSAQVRTTNLFMESPDLPDGNGHWFHIRTIDNAGNVSETVHIGPFYIDTIPPANASVVIAGGAATTDLTQVSLALAAADGASDINQMQFSNDGGRWSVPIPFSATAVWNLTVGAGDKTVYARFSDQAGNWMTNPVSDTIRVVGVPGDVNGDGAVNLIDAILAMRIAVRIIPPAGAIRTGYTPATADVNGNGKINMAEVIYILQKMAGVR